MHLSIEYNYYMEKIIVVECTSTSVNYINDIRSLDYEPIAMELYEPKENRKFSRFIHDFNYKAGKVKKPKIIYAHKNYAKTLKLVKKIKPKLVIPGSDAGLYMAMKLSNDLKLVSNSLSIYPSIAFKDKMHDALKRAGLRYIRSKKITTLKQASDFYKLLGQKHIVVKPHMGTSSNNVSICSNKLQLNKAVNKILQSKPKNSVILQEYINGKECCVNSASCNGEHKITSIKNYFIKVDKDGGILFDSYLYTSPNDSANKSLIKYALQVLDALKIKFGPVHAEYMIDKKGPILIEVNCRIPGLMLRGDFLDQFLPHHETDIALYSYLKHDKFFSFKNQLISPTGYCGEKNIIIPHDMFVVKTNIEKCFKNLKSYYYYTDLGSNRIYTKTIGLSTCGGTVYLTSKNKKVVLKDLEYIKKFEKEHFDKLYETR